MPRKKQAVNTRRTVAFTLNTADPLEAALYAYLQKLTYTGRASGYLREAALSTYQRSYGQPA